MTTERPISIINLSARAALARPVPFADLQRLGPAFTLETRGNQHVKRGNNVLRNRDGALLTIYPNGTVWITGAKSRDEVLLRIAWFTCVLSAANLPDLGPISIRNIVVQSAVDLRGNLADTYAKLLDHVECVYDPEEFPAMRIKAPHSTILLWGNSKVTMAGAKSIEEASQDLEWLEATAHAAGCQGGGEFLAPEAPPKVTGAAGAA